MSETAQPTAGGSGPPVVDGVTRGPGRPRELTYWEQILSTAERFTAGLARYVPDEEVPDRRGNRAALAALRRSLGKPPGESLDALPYVVPLLPGRLSPWAEGCHYLVAALFALYPKAWTGKPHRSLGLTMRDLARTQANERGGNGDAEAGQTDGDDRGSALDTAVERRFVALLNAEGDGFATHLRYAVSLLKARDQRIDWAQLLRDIRGWKYEDRRVQRAWAGDFWAGGQRGSKPSQGNGSDGATTIDAVELDDGETGGTSD